MVDRNTNPKDLTTEELEERYRSTQQSAVGNFKFDAEASLLSIEMNRRAAEESTKGNQRLALENHKLSIENHKLSRRSIGISFLALFIAVVSATFSYVDWKEDGVWQEQQIGELSKISESLKEANQLLHSKPANEEAEEVKSHNKSMPPTTEAAPD